MHPVNCIPDILEHALERHEQIAILETSLAALGNKTEHIFISEDMTDCIWLSKQLRRYPQFNFNLK